MTRREIVLITAITGLGAVRRLFQIGEQNTRPIARNWKVISRLEFRINHLLDLW